ncbi:MAG TPA: glycosyltransferase [Candidatus Deferrimicrobium sp.]|nr:glycosyltransferase [Candidatus Deferrimicrobium sp.]
MLGTMDGNITPPPAGSEGMTAQSKIAIAYLINNFGMGGGTENQLAMLVKNLDKSRFTAHVFALQSRWEDAKFDLECPVTYLNVDKLISFRSIVTFFRFSRLLRRLNIQVLQIVFYDCRIFGVPAGRLAGVKRIVLSRRDYGWGLSRGKVRVMRWMSRLSHYCLVNARAVKEMVMRLEAFPEDRIEVVYNGVEANTTSPESPVTRAALGIPEGAPVIGMVANLRRVKRVDRFIRVAALMKHKESHYVVIGWAQHPEVFEQEAAAAGVGERMHFIRTVHHVYDVVRQFSVGVLTSESEGLSNSLIEYSACGVPAVAFDVGGNAEIILDNQSGFVVPDGDVAMMAAKIDYLLDNPDTSRQFGNRATEHATAAFNVEGMVQKTEAFYLRILGQVGDTV